MTAPHLFEYSGAIHIHSVYSDGSGEIPDILNAAQAAGLDFAVLTDHNTLRARTEGWEGWHGGVLLMVGEEVTNARHGHCLAIGTSSRVNHRQTPEGIIRDIQAQQGLAFLAHPHGVYRPFLRVRDHSWKDWSVNSYTGLELWSYMFDWASSFRYYRWSRHYRDPNGQIRGPFSETLQTWDRLCRKMRIVGIGGVDAHARRYPLTSFTVFPYAELFRTVRTHVLTRDPLTGSASEDIPQFLRAVREGHCFISYDLLCDGRGTRFGAADGTLLMGDESAFNGPVDLEIHLPARAEVTILKDGLPFKSLRAAAHTFRADSHGVYRVEARLEDKPWIYTNPIYLRPGCR